VDILDLIKSRRSVREFTDELIDDQQIEKILEAGRWAPSGLNNQPWRFCIIRDEKIKDELAKLTHYGSIIKNAPISIVVFLSLNESYDRTKDVMAVGACIQNMLLTIHSLGLGGVWLGEILKNKETVNEILNVPKNNELMAIIALGNPKPKNRKSSRKKLGELILR